MSSAVEIQVVDAASSGFWNAAIDLAVEYELQLVSLFTENLNDPEALKRTRHLAESMFKNEADEKVV